MVRSKSLPEQLGFLDAFDREIQVRETAHLPSEIKQGIALYMNMLGQFDAAMRTVDLTAAEKIYDEAHRLAVKLNKGEPGIIAEDDSPGNVLARETAAPAGTAPLWGQTGDFVITIGTMRVRIELDGIMGIGLLMPSFSANAIDFDRPFLSHTGYRSFYGLRAAPDPGMSVVDWVTAIVTAYVHTDCKRGLVAIDDRYRKVFTTLPGPTLP